MDYYRIKKIEFLRNYVNFDLCMMIKGSRIYKRVFENAFPQCYFSREFKDKHKKYNWGTYIKNAYPDTTEKELRSLGDILRKHIFLDDDLNECYALDYHLEYLHKRTEIGQLVYRSKSYDTESHQGNKMKAEELANHYIHFIKNHPTLNRIKIILTVPPSNPDKTFDLPNYIAKRISEKTGKILAHDKIKKTRTTKQMKSLESHEDKVSNIMGSIDVDKSFFRRKQVLIVDDIYQTGTSINEVGRVLKGKGATYVIGLVATKTLRD